MNLADPSGLSPPEKLPTAINLISFDGTLPAHLRTQQCPEVSGLHDQRGLGQHSSASALTQRRTRSCYHLGIRG